MILFGGKSVEHDISIITALQVAKSLPEQFEYLPIYIDKDFANKKLSLPN